MPVNRDKEKDFTIRIPLDIWKKIEFLKANDKRFRGRSYNNILNELILDSMEKQKIITSSDDIENKTKLSAG